MEKSQFVRRGRCLLLLADNISMCAVAPAIMKLGATLAAPEPAPPPAPAEPSCNCISATSVDAGCCGLDALRRRHGEGFYLNRSVGVSPAAAATPNALWLFVPPTPLSGRGGPSRRSVAAS
jgi:hypothetical protein